MTEFAIAGGRYTGKTTRLLELAREYAEADNKVLWVSANHQRARMALNWAKEHGFITRFIRFSTWETLPKTEELSDFTVLLIDDADEVEFAPLQALLTDHYRRVRYPFPVMVIAGKPSKDWFTSYFLVSAMYERAAFLEPNLGLDSAIYEAYTDPQTFKREILGDIT